MKDIIAIGEILIDLTQTGVNENKVPLFAANPGGAPANVAVAASRLGASAGFVGKVGGDGFGAYLRRVLEGDGVDCSGLYTGSAPTTMAVVAVDERGERSFRFVRGADRDLTPDEAGCAAAGTRVLHFGSVSLTADPARSATLAAVRAARESGVLVSYDPNYRSALWPSQEEAVEWMRRPLELADVLKLSDEELPLLTGTDRLEEGARALTELGVRLVLVTLGGAGVYCRWRDESWRQSGVSVKVADTNGAGDTFLGAVLSRLCRRGDKAPLEDLSRAELEDILSFANRAAALTCSRSGAIPAMPSLAELEG